MTNDKGNQLLCKRFVELANIAQLQYRNTFTSFLTLNEMSLFYRQIKDLPNVLYSIYGGIKDCERKMICFHGEEHLVEDALRASNHNEIILSPEEYKEIFPICCIHIEPVNVKFSDELNHRDFLGAIMNLGIERSKLGDILLNDKEGFVFCEAKISDYLVQELRKIKHTIVETEIVENNDLQFEPKFKEIKGTVSSVRLDAIIAEAFQSSRSQMTGYIAGGKVFVNGKETLSNSYVLKENDIVSVRGMGKFLYAGTAYQTKKGRYSITTKRYI